jgi:hypothetical protein
LKTLETSALRFENVKFFKKPALYALKTLNFKLTLPSLIYNISEAELAVSELAEQPCLSS